MMARSLEYNIGVVKETEKYGETMPNQQLGKGHNFTIHGDETDDFVPDNDYLDLIIECNKALEGLQLKNNTFNNYVELNNWLSKYKESAIYKSLNNKTVSHFNNIYEQLLYFQVDENSLDIVKKAARELLNIDLANNETVLEWLLKYEDSYTENPFTLFSYWETGENKYLELEFDKDYKIIIHPFEDFTAFLKFYNNYYYEEIEKLKIKYLSQQNMTLEEFEGKANYNHYGLNYFYKLINKEMI